MNNNNTILVTGFGPFGIHKVNTSWEAVKTLPDEICHNNKVYKITKIHVPVAYDDVNDVVDKIWKSNPKLVIHCGVHTNATKINLERRAFNNEFQDPDCKGKVLSCQSVSLKNNGKIDELFTKINVENITNELNREYEKNMFYCSTDVGKYLCGYLYLNSLDRNCERSLFVHVPPQDKPFKIQELSKAIYDVIGKCLDELCSC